MSTLITVRFGNLIQWDIKRLAQTGFCSHMPVVPLGNYIIEQSQKYYISNPNQQYGILGVNNKTGIFDAYQESGSNIHQKYKKMEDGWIAYNPYRVNVGSIGIKKPEHKNQFISPAYIVFSCTADLLPEYLYLLMKTPSFNKIIRNNTTGSVRQNLSFSVLKNLLIPLPSLSRQNELVATYNQTIAFADDNDEKSFLLEKEIEHYLSYELGTKITKSVFSKGINFVSFADTERWDYPFFFSSSKIKSRYATTAVSNCIDHFMEDVNGKTIRVETSKYPNNDFHYLGMENVEKNTGELIDMPIVKGLKIKSQTISVPKDYLIYGKLRPYLNKYWLNDTQLIDIVCSSEFFVFHTKPDLNNLFFKYVLASSFVQQQLLDQSSGARMPRINETVFKNIQIPIPPHDVQNAIAAHIKEIKQQIKSLKQQATNLRDKALTDFEKELF